MFLIFPGCFFFHFMNEKSSGGGEKKWKAAIGSFIKWLKTTTLDVRHSCVIVNSRIFTWLLLYYLLQPVIFAGF